MINNTTRKVAAGAAAFVALGLGGAAIAGAAGNGTSTSAKTRSGAPQREPLSTADAAKVKAAALEKVPGATVLRTEAGGPYGTPYHAHVRTSGGTRQVVLVNASFEATTVQADNARRGRGGPGRHGGAGRGERALTGETKTKVEAAVEAEYPRATIVRTETNAGGDAPYESHIETSDGRQLEVLVSSDFEVVDAGEHPARP